MSEQQEKKKSSQAKVEEHSQDKPNAELNNSDSQQQFDHAQNVQENKTPNPPKSQQDPCGHVRGYPLPRIDFATFLISLYHSALAHLGEVKIEGQKEMVDLPTAKQYIDILHMLKEKTKGNLSDEEDRALCSMLYELQMMYIKKKA
jgi:hypothetical protein